VAKVLIVGWSSGVYAVGGAIRAALAARIGSANVTLVVEQPGASPEDAERVRQAAASCDALVVLIDRGRDKPSSAMGAAISAASRADAPVIPVLLEGASTLDAWAMFENLGGRTDAQPIVLDGTMSHSAAGERVASLVMESLEAARGEVRSVQAPPSPPAPAPSIHAPAGHVSFGIEAEPEEESVMLGAAAPRAVMPGNEFTARFVAYPESAEPEVKALLADLAPQDAAHLGIKSCRWKPGAKVSVALAGRDLTVSPSPQTFVWEGTRVLLDFDVAVAADAPPGRTVLKFDAAVDGIVVGMLRIDLEITRAGRDDRPAATTAEAARTAFASYSSMDRERVLDRVAAVRISAGLDIFMDCLSLHPGEAWKPRLADEIRARDLFLLFWSQDSAASKWVEWEWRTALAEKGNEHMQIHPLATGVAPPEELKDLHFGDVYMLIREAGEAKKARPGNPST
jgi:hypothetical protein